MHNHEIYIYEDTATGMVEMQVEDCYVSAIGTVFDRNINVVNFRGISNWNKTSNDWVSIFLAGEDAADVQEFEHVGEYLVSALGIIYDRGLNAVTLANISAATTHGTDRGVVTEVNAA